MHQPLCVVHKSTGDITLRHTNIGSLTGGDRLIAIENRAGKRGNVMAAIALARNDERAPRELGKEAHDAVDENEKVGGGGDRRVHGRAAAAKRVADRARLIDNEHVGVRVPRPRVRRELLRKVARGRRLARLLDVEQRQRADLGRGALHGAAAGPAVRPNHERR